MLTKKVAPRVILACLLLLLAAPTQAAPPPGLNYQGYLMDAAGYPEDGEVDMTFLLYDALEAGKLLWFEDRRVTVSQGVFSVRLGVSTVPFPTGIFERPVYLAIEVANEELKPRQPLSSSPGAYAAENAQLLQGRSAQDLDQSDHVDARGNPHQVSWRQLQDVPSGFADGVDNDAGGDVTAVLPGFGLSGGGDAGGITLSADPTVLQRRVGGECATGESIRRVNADGTVFCEPDSTAETICDQPLLLDGGGGCVEPNAHAHTGQAWSTVLGGTSAFSVVNATGTSGTVAIHGGQTSNPAHGYLGVVGTNDFRGIDELDIVADEIGVLGTAVDGGAADNVGVYGYSNGVGIHGAGGLLAGRFVGDIEVSGDATVDRVAYTTPRTHAYSLSDGDFHAASNELYRVLGGGGAYVSETGPGQLIAGVHLPDGAVVTGFRAIVEDNAIGDLTVDLRRRQHAAAVFQSVASVSTSGTPGIGTLVDQTITATFAGVDNAEYGLMVRVFSSNWPGNTSLRIKAAVIEYALSEAH
ncbi:MAG: hypothetical protein QNK03_01925 [Myxococcota bacterium]|nr:hypothetical protein [Myxococcota bacterium]